jgi:hypothetical protein
MKALLVGFGVVLAVAALGGCEDDPRDLDPTTVVRDGGAGKGGDTAGSSGSDAGSSGSAGSDAGSGGSAGAAGSAGAGGSAGGDEDAG